ncbi:MAG: hypothetical protein AAGF07_05085 [Patescibacteria group bacterium]
MFDNYKKVAPKIISVLWGLWGLYFVVIGFALVGVTYWSDKSFIAEAIDSVVGVEFSGRQLDIITLVLFDAGYNFIWAGAVAFISSFFIWKRNIYAMFLATLVGCFIELPIFLPSPAEIEYTRTVGTIIPTLGAWIAIILSIHFIYSDKQNSKKVLTEV